MRIRIEELSTKFIYCHKYVIRGHLWNLSRQRFIVPPFLENPCALKLKKNIITFTIKLSTTAECKSLGYQLSKLSSENTRKHKYSHQSIACWEKATNKDFTWIRSVLRPWRRRSLCLSLLLLRLNEALYAFIVFFFLNFKKDPI